MRLWPMQMLGPSVPIVANGMTFVIDHDAAGLRAQLLA